MMNDPNPRCSNPDDPLDPNSPRTPADNEAVYIQPADPQHSVEYTTKECVVPVLVDVWVSTVA